MLTVEERALVSAANAIKTRERKAARKARPVNLKADRGRVRDSGYLAYLRRQACVVGPAGCSGPIEAAHVRIGGTGMQRKPSDQYAVSLCAAHHRTGPDAQHGRGERQWWSARGMDPFAVAARQFAEYQRGAA